MVQVLRRYAASGRVEPGRCREALDDLLDFPLDRYPHDLLLRRVWGLRHNITAYDAVYVALAFAFSRIVVDCLDAEFFQFGFEGFCIFDARDLDRYVLFFEKALHDGLRSPQRQMTLR